MDRDDTDTTRATARLPGLDIEVTHRRAADDAEQVSISLRAAPSVAAFGRAFEAANPFALWAPSAPAVWLAAWLPYLEAARMMGLTLRWATAPARPRQPGGDGPFPVAPHCDG